MKKVINLLGILLIFTATTTMFSSCGDDENDPLTNESIAGKKYYTDKKLFGVSDDWEQAEISFTFDGYAYLQLTEIDFETGDIYKHDRDKATYNLDYPNIAFDYGGSYNIYAHFICEIRLYVVVKMKRKV